MDDHLRTNRDLWDGWTELHRGSSFYDVDAFRAGACTLNQIELDAVGELAGRTLLHLQCHFGLDTLSWARRGATVTGVDFSERAIALARRLAAEIDIPADFHCSDVTRLPPEWTECFDIVFTSYGVLPWLSHLRPWADTIARVLRPGGVLHLVEFHPFATMLDDDGRIGHRYFHSSTPDRYEVEGSYADPDADFSHTAFEWSHSLSELLGALSDAGLRLEAFREYPYSPHGCYGFLEESAPGRWTVRGVEVDVPLVFSVEAAKPRP